MPTRIALKQDIINVFAARDEALAGLTMPLTTTSLGSSTTLIDTGLIRGTVNANFYDGRVIEIVELVTNGPAVGSTRGVTDGGISSSNGTLTFLPTGNTVQTGTDYLIYPLGLTPEMVNEGINRVLRNTDVPFIWAPSLVEDADFEDVVLTAWADVGSPSPATAFTITVADVLLGERAIKVQTDATSEGITSNDFRVTENEQLMIVCYVRAQDDAVIVSLYDSTANSDITPTVTIDEQLYTEARFTRAVADNMEIAQIRFIGSTNASEFYVAAPVIVQSMSVRSYPCPSWLVDPENQVKEAWYMPAGFASEASDSYVALSKEARMARMPTFLRSDRYLTPLRLELEADAAGPVVLSCMRPLVELTTDSEAISTTAAPTGVTPADRQYVTHKVVANIMRDRGDTEWRMWAKSAATRAHALGYGEKSLVWSEGPLVSV